LKGREFAVLFYARRMLALALKRDLRPPRVKAPVPSNRFNVYNRHQKAHFRPPSPKITAVLVQLFTSGRTGHVIRGQRDILPLDISIGFIFARGEGSISRVFHGESKESKEKRSASSGRAKRARELRNGAFERNRALSSALGFTCKKGT